MSLFYLLLIAIVQGVTEFLPVSSSGHLILLPGLSGVEDQGLAIDAAVHVGTLGAVIVYFRHDVGRAMAGLLQLLKGQTTSQDARLALCLIIGTIPVVLFGLFLHVSGYSEAMRSIKVIGWTMLVFGVVLYWADQTGPKVKTDRDWGIRDAIIMGLWQAIALIPGTSRSGATITGARKLGYDRENAARLSMLMSIPTIIASGTLLGVDVAAAADMETAKNSAIGALFAFFAALLALTLMMRLLRSVSFTPYVIYRVALGAVLLVIAYT